MVMMKVLVATSLLLAANAAPETFTRPCDGKSYSWCDHTKGMEERVESLVANLTNDEKSVLFVNGAGAVPRIGWPAYQWWSEALHGVARDGLATSFPQICGGAASYNRSLWHMIGDVTSTEGRGKNQEYSGQMYHGLTFWAPNVNVKHDHCPPLTAAAEHYLPCAEQSVAFRSSETQDGAEARRHPVTPSQLHQPQLPNLAHEH